MELDETIVESMLREVKEETGVEVGEYRFFGMLTSPKYNIVYPHGDVTQGVSAMFEVRLKNDTIQLDEEHSRFAWFAEHELPENMLQQTVAAYAKYKEFRRTGEMQFD